MKRAEEVMEILEAYDLTGSFRQAAAVAGCDHKTVAHWVAVREATGGAPPVRAKHRRPVADPVSVKVEELVDARAGGSGPIRRTPSWSRWGVRGPSARRAEQLRRRSGAGGRSMGGGPDRGFRSPVCGFSGTMARGR